MTTMDFFGQQARASRSTSLLVVMFIVAVVLIVVSVHFGVCAAIYFFLGGMTGDRSYVELLMRFEVLAVVAGGTCIIILGGTIAKMIELRQGGSIVAASLGGTHVSADTLDSDERKLHNIVDEMSIASGCPKPELFVLNQEGSINAFAAGFTPQDAAIGVTRGAIARLTRDELQGVIAHEFSHILNGDMRLNVRLIGLLHGLVGVGMLGAGMVRIAASTGGRDGNRDVRAVAPLLALGVVIFVIGSIGVFFARLIKSAVSRQREYLADAAAVQFTRNPDGLAGALRKIGGLSGGSVVHGAAAEEASHMFFGSVKSIAFLDELFSTHPPLGKRIKLIDPAFDGTYPEVPPVAIPQRPVGKGYVSRKEAPVAAPLPFPPINTPSPQMVQAAAILASIGNPTPDKIDFARRLLDSLPENLRQATRRVGGAQGIIYALLLTEDDAGREAGSEAHRDIVPAELRFEVQNALVELGQADPRARLALLELSLPALRQMYPAEAEAFCANVHRLVLADEKTTLAEYVILQFVVRSLDTAQRAALRRGPQYYAIAPLLGDIAVLLSAIAHRGDEGKVDPETVFRVGTAAIGRDGNAMVMVAPWDCALDAVLASFKRLSQASPQIKQRVLSACATAIAADDTLTLAEAELLRSIAISLDCPMPPIFTSA